MDLRNRIQAKKLQDKLTISSNFINKEQELEKAKYFKREGFLGNYKYYYSEEEYKKVVNCFQKF